MPGWAFWPTKLTVRDVFNSTFQVASAASAEPDPDGCTCQVCGEQYSSRTQLFAHIKTSGHAVLREGSVCLLALATPCCVQYILSHGPRYLQLADNFGHTAPRHMDCGTYTCHTRALRVARQKLMLCAFCLRESCSPHAVSVPGFRSASENDFDPRPKGAKKGKKKKKKRTVD